MRDEAPVRRAVVLDKHPLWLDAIGRALAGIDVDASERLTVPTQALAAVTRSSPDLFVLDPTVRDATMDGLECLRRAMALAPGMKSIAVSAAEDFAIVSAAFEAGASAYVVKRASPDDLRAAVRQAFEHSIYLPLPQPTEADEEARAAAGPALTHRESEILALVAEGKTNAQIARQLWLTEQTVKFHLVKVYRKLGVANRTEASLVARRIGLARPSSATGD